MNTKAIIRYLECAGFQGHFIPREGKDCQVNILDNRGVYLGYIRANGFLSSSAKRVLTALEISNLFRVFYSEEKTTEKNYE